MSTNSTTKEYRLSKWFPIVKTCRESGMTVKAWCEQHDVNEKAVLLLAKTSKGGCE